MEQRILPSGMEVGVLGRCVISSFCSETATHYVEFKPRPDYVPLHSFPPRGGCQRHVEAKFVSDEEYNQRFRDSERALGPDVQKRSDYVIRPLNTEEAAEVAYEQAAPDRWAADGTIGAVRRVYEMHSAEEIDGVLIDAFSAAHVIRVYDALNEKNRARFAKFDVVRMVEVAFQLVQSQK
ncbi:hypothetical protein [Streptomyces sp. NPDC059080]|uniref:hypothetical protein n=1 Tax=Streptomyces sp. NPDC059080 TaxID=3346718 RepID=UPI0036A08623